MEREVGGGIGMGKTCKLKDVSFQCMTKFTTNKKKKEKKKKKEMYVLRKFGAANLAHSVQVKYMPHNLIGCAISRS